MDELPEMVQDKLLSSYLYNGLLSKFFGFFRMRRKIAIYDMNKDYYTWNDSIYRDYMIQLLTLLVPFTIASDEIIHDELESMDMVSFITKGKIKIGFEINKHKRFCLNYGEGFVIGGFNVTYG